MNDEDPVELGLSFRGGGRGRGGTTGNGLPNRGRGRGSGFVPGLPRNTCSTYWTTGACKFGFDCRFDHTLAPTALSSGENVEDVIEPDFFSIQALAENNGAVKSSEHSLKPGQVHNHLKSILSRGRLPFAASYMNMEGFVRIFASVHSGNSSWVRRFPLFTSDLPRS